MFETKEALIAILLFCFLILVLLIITMSVIYNLEKKLNGIEQDINSLRSDIDYFYFKKMDKEPL